MTEETYDKIMSMVASSPYHCVWDEESVDFLDSIGVPFFKMASADLTNFPLLEHTAKKDKPMIISTGMTFRTMAPIYFRHLFLGLPLPQPYRQLQYQQCPFGRLFYWFLCWVSLRGAD